MSPNMSAQVSREEADDVAGPPRINSLWIGGRLSTLEWLSMLPHVRHGHEYQLWAYEDMHVPAGVILKDAGTICDKSSVFSYQVGTGKGSVSAFSNLFRYFRSRYGAHAFLTARISPSGRQS